MVKEVAQHFHVSESAISRLRTKYRQTGTIKDRPRPGRPRKTTRREDNFIVTSSRRNRFLSSTRIAGLVRNATGTRICPKTVRNRLRAARLRGRRPYVDARPQADKTKLDEGTSSLDQTAVESSCLHGRISLQFKVCGRKITCLEARW